MYHTPPKMVNTRNIAKKEMQKKVEEKKDAHHVRDESQNVEQHKVDKDDTGTQDARTMFDKNQPGPSVETNVIMSTKKSSVCSSTLAKKKRLEAEAAEAKARIRMELIDKKLEADLAELESSAGSSTTSSKKTSSKYKDRAVETWLYSNQQEVKTQCVTDHGINYDVLGPAPQESNLHHLRATGPQPLATKIALEARPLPTSSGTDETVHALASALKDLAAAGVNNSNDKMLSRLCTPRDLPLYSGDPLEWLQFKQAYEESSQVCNFSEKENLWRLRRSLQGPAKEAVTALLIGATSPDVVMSTLELQFGNPDIIITRIMQDITKLRPMAQEYFKDIIPFSVKVRNCVAAVTAIGCEDYLKGMNIVSVILSKLPTVLISKWTDYSYPFINDRNKPKLVILSEFLSEEAVKITKTSVNLFQVQSFSKQSYNDNRKTNRILLLNNEHSENNNSDTCCKNCHISKHSLQECNKFKKSMRKNRWTYVKRNGLCYKCLKSKHKHNSCPAPVCDVNDCGLPHHRLLHFTVKSVPCNNVNITDTTQTDTESPVETINHVTVNNNKILLKTVPIYLHGPNGTFRCFALLDDGSTVTLISEALASKTGLHGNKQSMRVCGAWNNSALLCQTEILNLNLSNDEGTKFTIRARSVKNLNLPEQNYADINLNNYELMKPEIKNMICNGQCKPELLIGQDNYDLMLPLQIIKTKSTEPFFTRTPLGWCMHGRTRISTVTNDEMKHTLLLNEEQNTESERIMREIQDEMRQMFAIETLGVSSKPRQNVEDVRAYEHLQRTAILKNGSWYVGIPWKDTTSTMPDSYDNALSRFRSIEKKMKSNPNFAKRYKERIDHLLINEYASELTETKNPERIWYLPHFGVDNPNKQKLRLVFDAAARNDGLCLNDYILKGPDLLTSLYGIMLRFRENRIAVTGDIRDMFLRIKILKEDRDALRFLWRDSPGVPVKSWVMNSLIFGANCSPFISQFIKNKNADKFQSSMPSAVRAIHDQHYMGDYIDSLEDEATAIELVNDITYIHKQGGFEMRNWTSNIQSILRDLPGESLNSTSVSFKSGEQYEGERTLGLIWFPTDDHLAFDTSFKRIHTTILTGQNKPTKREMLRILMSVFDIHGFLSPITITGKIILQDTWRAGITWDDVIPEKIYLKWLRWLSAIKNLNHMRLPRHYAAATRNISCSDNIRMSETHDYSAHAPSNSAPRPSPYGERYTNLQLHVFCDASTQAMCAVAYWRWTDRENTIRVAFVSSKCRVAPVKYVSMPRLELQAAVMAGRLANVISSEHRMKAERKYFWCDSSTVLYWIRNNARNYKAYIVHRLGELDELTKVDEWRYIPTKLNVADIATREFCEIKTLKDEWLYGPLFLYNDDQSWPRELDIQQPDGNYVDLECINIIHNITRYLPAVPEPERFSSWLRLLKTMSMVLYFIGKCKKLNSCVDGAMMERAEKILLKYSQVKTFPDDLHNLQHNKSIDKKSKLFNLTPVLDDYGIIRLGGRIDAAPEISTNVKRPVILDGGCHVTHLIVKFYHMKACHGNQEMVVNEIKQKYWIIRLRPTVKYISSKCMLCRIKKSQPYPPRMGDLPEARLTHHQRPFTCTGVDLFGPLEVTVCRHREKRYGVIFTCLTIRAIHIEIVNELTTDALIMALRRMAARRGWPRYLYSDNGTNLRGADTELKKCVLELDELKLKEGITAYSLSTTWIFIPPASPHWGGAWERLIRSIKCSLKVILRERAPRDETLITLLAEVEHMVNSRPLTHVTVEPNTNETLTPNHFLIGTSSNLPTLGSFSDSEMCLKKQWRISQALADMYWKRWIREVLPDMRPRKKWQAEHRPLQVGDLVLIVDPSSPRNVWPKVWSWKLSRTNTLTQNATTAINQVINSIQVLNNRYYQTVDRSDAACFYFPEPGTSPVVFRGQCDQSIAVVQNFDAARYLGLWHDIESYPTEFQGGTCSNAYYSLSAAGVDVFNTQVINQTLDTINGLATLATTDGSAKLLVSFQIPGTNLTTLTDYWVLATDYSSYSLVYSCRNLNSEQRQVSSWKLSRTKQLTAAASTAINNAINNVNVVDQRYFLTVDQTPTGCFYFPEAQLGVPVVFPGQCDTNIPVVQNFNFAQFQGLWHEIQAYPKDQQPGQCVNHQFTTSGANGFNLVSSSVLDQFLGITNSAVTSVTNDGSGRFTITINNNGTVISFPYWILATDYTSYALAYSCVNINSDFRGVWSWKLSRAQSLTAAANTAINNVITPIQVLDNVYYENIDQSADACFYLPEIPPGQPIVLPGQCDPNITVVQNFNAARYLGRWRLIEGYPSDSQGGTCEEANYSLGPNGTVVVFNTEVRNQILSTITGTAVLATTDGSGKLSVTFPDIPGSFEYWILDTDYDSYALVYGCVNININQRRVWSWKLSRTNTLTANATNAINTVVNSINVLNNRYYQRIDRSDAACFYFPEPSSDPVVFRGQCDQNIPVVQNFNAVRYMGLWHDIERYPTQFQSGTCSNAYYSLSNNGVDVYNTQVINQTLDTINGLATLATTDGSAKLIVSFPVAGTNLTTQTDYWVLATDYDSYSFVYSCRNLNAEQRQVTSWKLSRAKQLTTAAITVINNVINTVNVLDPRYFQSIDQSAVGCFYYPEPRPGVPVIFPGQCDTGLSVVQNFNMAQFQGVWHEIDAYPKINQPGQCINHQFTLGATNTLNLIASNVLNQALGVSTGTVTFSSTDQSARLTITLPSNNTAIVIPYWIIATDYNNYALAYSCVNQDSDFRRVWSWKLSRTKQLTAASNQAITAAMANVNILDNRYYEQISQTDDSCFYLPDLAPGEPVIFVGQCDTNITVMQNFNVSRYLGRWNLIQTYPSDFQDGQCNDATYSLNANGSVLVYNTNVVNQTLSSMTGSAVLATTDGSGKLLVTFPSLSATLELWVLDTDYESYSLVYSCANLGSDRRRVWSWKMSRTNALTTSATNAINQVINRVNVLDNRYFLTVDRSAAACFYFPTPGSTPVRFRGQCEQNIPVVQSFNAVRYMGLWHDIESYPAPFQMGTCSNAEYTLNADGTVSVYNTQVVNQVLDVMTGTAVLASTDGSARLRVTFLVGGVNVTTDYWVLATDYDSYAFVYSCANVNAEYREVFSWKLSRQQNLTVAANTAINTVINNVQVLRQDYFINRDQSEQGCFYYPDNFGGDVILPGQCVASNLVQAVANFTANRFAGTWHEVARFPSDLQDGECAATDYVLNNQTTFSVTQTIVRNERQNARFIPSAVVSSDGRAIISASVSGVPINSIYILATDYSEYALAYSCRNINAFSKQIYSWKLSRSRSGLSAAANNAINTIVSNNIDLFEGYYSYTRQTNDACFYYPVFDQLPNFITLPGPCNETIRGFPNFNLNAYLGRWMDVARYPQPTQQGQCNRGYYNTGNNVINISRTQVTNRTLSTQEGTAMIASNDGSGLLNITFNLSSGPVSSNYYVLTTDYTSYSLVYSCQNLPDGNRRVGSWKLSRTTTLSAQANNIMNAIITNTQGLLEEYYRPTSQSDADCFFVPELNPVEAPLFRGQCENITGVGNFSVNRYLGWWHEIERYPSSGNVGQCISSLYELPGNQLNVVDTSVTNNTGTVVTGTVVATGDGRLRRTLANGQVQDIWVIDTDYNSYALLYSCENVGDEFRRVWSAKHSKTRQLTQAAQNIMAPIIENNTVLFQHLYLPVDQSETTCFHYPVQTGQRVIIPGQCDTNIPVEQNFDVAAYAGTWYQIERYEPISANVTCVGKRYTRNQALDRIDILNWQVTGGVLETSEARAVMASSDGSGRLYVTVTIGSSSETITLYVLRTDYENYALTYNCVNVNSYQRAVQAWKLSRARTMPAVGTTAINAYMSSRQELHQPYFRQIVQNDNCEEPSSAFLVKSSIIVVLICAMLQMFL